MHALQNMSDFSKLKDDEVYSGKPLFKQKLYYWISQYQYILHSLNSAYDYRIYRIILLRYWVYFWHQRYDTPGITGLLILISLTICGRFWYFKPLVLVGFLYILLALLVILNLFTHEVIIKLATSQLVFAHNFLCTFRV